MTDVEFDKEFEKLSKKEYGDDDICAALEKEDYVNKLSEKGPLAKVKKDISIFFSMLKDKDKYKLSTYSLAVIIGTLLYVITPLDLVPDIVPVLGLLDDVAILSTAVKAISNEINRYNEWKNSVS